MTAKTTLPKTAPAARQRRYVSVTVETDVTICLDRISTADLRAELADRERTDGESRSMRFERDYTICPADLEEIRRLFVTGQSAAATDRCRSLVADLLGVALC